MKADVASAVRNGKKPLDAVSVLVLTSGHEALDGRIYAREARSLRDLGADVVVVGRLTQGRPGEVPVLSTRAPRSRLERFVVQPWRCLWAGRRLDPDIVHFHDAEILATLPIARLLWRRARFVYDVHEDFPNLMRIRDWFPEWMKPLVERLTRVGEHALATLAHGVVAVTPPLAEKFPKHPRVVAYNYSIPEFFARTEHLARRPRDREYDLIHLGTLSRPRAVFLGEVLKELHARRPGARSLVLGAEESVLSAAAWPVGCDLVGKVPFERVAEFLGNAKVGIDVHPWQFPHLVPALAVKVCEYMACGCAVVASSMPVLERLLTNSGLEPDSIAIIRGGAPGDFAAAALRLVDAIEAGADPGGPLRSFARRTMNWENEAGKIADLYRQLLNEEPCAT